MVKYCAECGTKLEDNSEFCDNCGTRQNSKPKNNNRLIIIGLLVIIIIILGLFVATNIKSSTELNIESTTMTTDGEFVAKLTSNGNGIVGENVHVVFSDGQSFDGTTDNEGNAHINPNLNPGQYNVECSFQGDNKYSSSSVNGVITVDKAEPDYMAYTPFNSFSSTDKNNDGYVVLSDMNIAHTPKDIVNQMFSDADEDNDGKLNDYEYHKFMYLLNCDRESYGL